MQLQMLLLAVLLLAGPLARGWAQQPGETFRSLGDRRERPSDEHDRPYFRETQSHRGFEIRAPQFTVVADSGAEDARLAAAHVEHAWKSATNLAAQWTGAPGAADFGLNALQVVITSEPPRQQDEPATTVNVVGVQTQVQLNVGKGQPPLGQQLVRLRDGAAFAMLHTAGLDSIAPPWVVAGLASFAGRSGLTDEQLRSATASDRLPPLGGQQWRYGRGAPDQLAFPEFDREQAAERIAFWLTAGDGQHAPVLFQMLREAQAAVEAGAARSGGFQAATPEEGTVFDRFLGGRSEELAAWKANPLAGQPVFEAAQDVPAEVVSAEREMVTVLKLLARFPPRLTGPAGRGAKIVELNQERRPIARHVTSSSTTMSYDSFATELLRAANLSWATLDSAGGLLLSGDRERAGVLLFPPAARYDLDRHEGKTVLVRKQATGTTIRGWLEQNPQDATRPIARFAVQTTGSSLRVRDFKAAERR